MTGANINSYDSGLISLTGTLFEVRFQNNFRQKNSHEIGHENRDTQEMK